MLKVAWKTLRPSMMIITYEGGEHNHARLQKILSLTPSADQLAYDPSFGHCTFSSIRVEP